MSPAHPAGGPPGGGRDKGLRSAPGWVRPVPTVGDRTTAAERRADPTAWAFTPAAAASVYDAITTRRDVRRFRPDVVDPDVLDRVLGAAHAAPSVGHSQPWRFIVVRDPAMRERAALMADEQRHLQAAAMDPEAGRQLLDLQLEGIREAPLGVIVCCDRRVPPVGVLGRATFTDADMWSCACAIQNLWLAARAEGLGLGWVTLFPPDGLGKLLGLPEGVIPLGWLCLGWPDERSPLPGLERAGWSQRLPLGDIVFHERWPQDHPPAGPRSRLRAPGPVAVVAARDEADELLTPPGSLGALDRAIDRLAAMGVREITGELVLAVGRHRLDDLGVSAFGSEVTGEILAAALAGEAMGSVAARAGGLGVRVVDAGCSVGNLRDADALSEARVEELVELGRSVGGCAGGTAIAIGEVGIGNTTVAAALAALVLDTDAAETVGLGAGADASILQTKRDVVDAALGRARHEHGERLAIPVVALAALGGPEFAVMVGLVLGAAAAGKAVVLDGLATTVAAVFAVLEEPAVGAYLLAGQRSREVAHARILSRLGLEPLLDLRLRAGEGVGAVLATQLLRTGMQIRQGTGRTMAVPSD